MDQKVGNIDRLIGDDALILSLDLSPTEIVGDGTKTLTELNTEEDTEDGSFYLVTSKAAANSIFKDSKVNELYYSAKGIEVPMVGDKCLPFIEKIMADAKNLSITISSSEVNVTTLKDAVSKYRRGKGDATGTVTFQTMASQMTPGSLYNQFFKMVHVKADGSQTMSEIESKPIYLKSYLQKQGKGETQVFLFAQVELFGITIGADMGTAQEYSSNLRFIGADPILYVAETIA